MKADLHMHGPIGFQDYWLRTQGYAGKNLLEEIAKTCFERDIGICAITSDEDEIPYASRHDRFNWLKNNSTKNLSDGYGSDVLGKNILIVSKGDEKLYLVNGQTVRASASIRAREGYRPVDHLVVGNNNVPNGHSLRVATTYAHDHGLISIAEHPFFTAHGGVGEKALENMLPYIDAVEGHNSQLIFLVPEHTPLLGNYRRGLNKKAQEFAEEHNKPWIATSDAHRIKDAGLSYIEFDSKHLDVSDGDRFLGSLREIIKKGDFKPECHYENPIAWVKWVSRLMWGVKLGLDKR